MSKLYKIGTLCSLLALLTLGCASTRTAIDAEVSQCQATLPPAADGPPPELSTFDNFLNDYKAASPESRGALAQSFVKRQEATGGFPIVGSDGTVVFFFLGKGAEKELRVIGDFKAPNFYTVGWDPAGELMTRAAPDGAAFYGRLRFHKDARLDYQLVIDGERRPDPLNPRLIESGFAKDASELVMPGYKLPTEMIPRRDVEKGSLHVVEEPWAKPKVTIYLPPQYDPAHKYPVIYTADGAAWLNLIKLPTVLDNLIADKQITPALSVMIDATDDRSAWYYYNPGYLSYLEQIVAYVDGTYSTQANAQGRLHLGTSAGGRISLYVGLERPSLIGNIAMLSPSFGGPVHYFAPYFSGEKQPPPGMRVWLSAGTYEGSLCEDTQTMERFFDKVGLMTQAAYSHEGHSFGAWRHMIVDALKFHLSSAPAKR